jgi:hypothetical protein
VYVVGRTAEGHRQIVWRMAFYLEGKTSVGTNDLSPKEATQMSYDVKYIGYIELDVADILNVHRGAPFGRVLLHTQTLPQRGALL